MLKRDNRSGRELISALKPYLTGSCLPDYDSCRAIKMRICCLARHICRGALSRAFPTEAPFTGVTSLLLRSPLHNDSAHCMDTLQALRTLVPPVSLPRICIACTKQSWGC